MRLTFNPNAWITETDDLPTDGTEILAFVKSENKQLENNVPLKAQYHVDDWFQVLRYDEEKQKDVISEIFQVKEIVCWQLLNPGPTKTEEDERKEREYYLFHMKSVCEVLISQGTIANIDLEISCTVWINKGFSARIFRGNQWIKSFSGVSITEIAKHYIDLEKKCYAEIRKEEQGENK